MIVPVLGAKISKAAAATYSQASREDDAVAMAVSATYEPGTSLPYEVKFWSPFSVHLSVSFFS